MKRLIKLTLAVVLAMSSTSLFAQKFGRINMQELIAAMPETQEMQTNLQAYVKDLSDQMETLQVELNNKYNDFMKEYNTLSEGVRNVKEQEIQDMQKRLQDFDQWAQNDLQKKRSEMSEPILKKAGEAVHKISQAGGYLAVFDTSMPSLAYFDESALTDLLDQAKAELGIAATAPAAPAQ